MKIKKDYVLKVIGDEIVVIPTKDEAVRFNGIIALNKTAAFLFESLQAKDLTETQLVESILARYDVESQKATKDVEAFILKCKHHHLLED